MKKLVYRIDIYLDVIKKSFKSFSVYNMNIIMNLVSGFITVFVQIALWFALYESGLNHKTTLADVITYTLINSFIIKRCFIYMSKSISDSVYSGDIEIDLIRPVSMKVMATMRSIGHNLFDLCSFSFPIMLVIIIMYGIKGPKDNRSLICAIITAVLGQIIFWLFECILGYTAFWLKTNWYLAYIEVAVMTILGGTAIPIWFYPKWLQNICNYLPFKYAGYRSIYIYLYGSSKLEFLETILIQLIWIMFFLVMEKIIWYRAVRKIEVFGG